MDKQLREVIDSIQKPGRYIGRETNIIIKEHTEKIAKVVLCYPDLYEVGMSYLGLRILYHFNFIVV